MEVVVVTTAAIRRAKKLQSHHHHQQTITQCFRGRMPFLSPSQQCRGTVFHFQYSAEFHEIPQSPGWFCDYDGLRWVCWQGLLIGRVCSGVRKVCSCQPRQLFRPATEPLRTGLLRTPETGPRLPLLQRRRPPTGVAAPLKTGVERNTWNVLGHVIRLMIDRSAVW